MSESIVVNRADLSELYDMAREYADTALWDDEKPKADATLERIRNTLNETQ